MDRSDAAFPPLARTAKKNQWQDHISQLQRQLNDSKEENDILRAELASAMEAMAEMQRRFCSEMDTLRQMLQNDTRDDAVSTTVEERWANAALMAVCQAIHNRVDRRDADRTSAERTITLLRDASELVMRDKPLADDAEERLHARLLDDLGLDLSIIEMRQLCLDYAERNQIAHPSKAFAVLAIDRYIEHLFAHYHDGPVTRTRFSLYSQIRTLFVSSPAKPSAGALARGSILHLDIDPQ